MFKNIYRGDIWYVDFEPVEGHEQGGEPRPAVIISSDSIDMTTIEMAIVIPGTRTAQVDPQTNDVLPDVIRVEPSKDNGLKSVTYFLCNQIRAVSLKRMQSNRRIGCLTAKQIYSIEDILFFLLDLGEKDS